MYEALNSTSYRELDYRNHKIKLELDSNTFHPTRWAELLLTKIVVHADDAVIDVGTGSAALAIAAAKYSNHVFATDINQLALKRASLNAELNAVSIHFCHGEFFAEHKRKWDVIIGNLPQEIVFANDLIPGQQMDALCGGSKGNEIVLEFLRQSRQWMHAESRLYIPLCSLSFHLETQDYIDTHFIVRSRVNESVIAKRFVEDDLAEYLKLADAGSIQLTEIDGQWYHNLSILELAIRPSVESQSKRQIDGNGQRP